MTSESQESRTVIVGAKLTPSEKLKLEFVCGHDGLTVSDFIRDLIVPVMENRHEAIKRDLAELREGRAA